MRPWSFVLVLGICLALGLSLDLSAQQVVVSPGDLAEWLIGPFGAAPPVDFVDGPDTPPFGVGSYSVEIQVASSKIILGRNGFHDLPLGELTALSYWTHIDLAATNVNNWYLNLYLDADGDGAFETRLDYVPPAAQVIQGGWQFWDAFAGVWLVSTGGSSTIADFLTANPNARINAFDNPLALALRWNMGDTAASYVGFVGNLDGVRIAANGVGDTTWDFERVAPPSGAPQIPTLSPLLLAALVLVLGLAGVVALRRRTHRGDGRSA